MGTLPEKIECYLFVIDTDTPSYFHEDMCAYLTGQYADVGDGYLGAEVAKIEMSEKILKKIAKIIHFEPDEHSFAFPSSQFQGPDDKRKNSVAIFFSSVPEGDVLKVLIKRALTYTMMRNIKINTFRILEKRTVYKRIDIKLS